MVSSIVLLSSIPRCLMLFSVANPLRWKSCTRARDELMHKTEDFLRLMLRPLTPVYLSYIASNGSSCSIICIFVGDGLSSASRIGPTFIPSSVVYMVSANLATISLFKGSEPIRNSMLERGSPCPEPVLTVIRIPFLPLTSTLAIPTST